MVTKSKAGKKEQKISRVKVGKLSKEAVKSLTSKESTTVRGGSATTQTQPFKPETDGPPWDKIFNKSGDAPA